MRWQNNSATPLLPPVIISLQRDKRQKGRKRDKKADRTKDKKIKYQSWRQTLGSKKNVVANLLEFIIVIVQRSGGLKVDSS